FLLPKSRYIFQQPSFYIQDIQVASHRWKVMILFMISVNRHAFIVTDLYGSNKYLYNPEIWLRRLCGVVRPRSSMYFLLNPNRLLRTPRVISLNKNTTDLA